MREERRVTGAASGVKLTYDDFLLFPDDGMRHELIDGEHYVTPSPNTKHQRIQINMVRAMLSYLDAHPVGEIFCAPLDIVLSQHDVVEPDLFYISRERAAGVLTPENARGAPELVIEIASTSTRKRDETIKRRLYERNGVIEYWIVDLNADRIEVYRDPARSRYRSMAVLSRGDTITPRFAPDIAVDVTAVLGVPASQP